MIFNFEDSSKILELINRLNYIIEEQTQENNFEYYKPLEFRTDGEIAIITLFEQQIWDSDNDEREFNEEENEYEPLENFIRKQINNFVNTVKKIEL